MGFWYPYWLGPAFGRVPGDSMANPKAPTLRLQTASGTRSLCRKRKKWKHAWLDPVVANLQPKTKAIQRRVMPVCKNLNRRSLLTLLGLENVVSARFSDARWFAMRNPLQDGGLHERAIENHTSRTACRAARAMPRLGSFSVSDSSSAGEGSLQQYACEGLRATHAGATGAAVARIRHSPRCRRHRHRQPADIPRDPQLGELAVEGRRLDERTDSGAHGSQPCGDDGAIFGRP